MTRLTRAGLLALALPSLYAWILVVVPPRAAAAALLALNPGPIDHPLHLVGSDFNQDGYDDLAIANFEAGTVTVLINQKNGTFAPQKDSPNVVGGATVGQPSAGPLFLVVGDLDPEDVDGDRITNDVDDCPNVYNPANCPANDPFRASQCFVDIPCKDPSKAPLDCRTKDLVTQQCDSDNNGVGDQCQVLDVNCQTVDSDGDGVFDYVDKELDNCPLMPNPPLIPNTPQQTEGAAGLDGVCGTADDNHFLFGTDGQCGTPDDTPSKVGAACSRNADLVVVNTSSGGGSTLGLVRVRVNDGAGGLKSRNSQPASSGASQAVLADFNGDRRLDLVVSNSGTDALLLYPGADDGEMGAVCLGGSNAGRSCVGSSQCPGGTCQQKLILLTGGTCSGGTRDGQTCATTKDNCPGGTCRLSPAAGFPATCAGGSDPGKRCTQDKDCPVGGQCRSPAGPEGLAAADFNGDGLPDLAFANRTGRNVGILLNGGGAVFSPAPGSPFPAQDQPVSVLAGFLNGDGCADLVVLAQGLLTCRGGVNAGAGCSTDRDCKDGGGVCRADRGTIQVFTMNYLTFSLEAGQSIDLGSGHAPRGGALVDFDRDGNLDLAVADFTGGEVLVYAGSGSGTFTSAVTLAGLASPTALAPLNFDPDTGPNVDLAVLGFANNRVDLYRNSSSPGSLSFALASTSPVSPWLRVSAMALMPADASTGQDLVLLNDTPLAPPVPSPNPRPPRLDVLSGTGFTFRGLPPETLSGPTSATGMVVTDLRQDGLIDLLVLDGPGGTATPLITDLTGAQRERLPVAAGTGPVQAAVGPLTIKAGDYDKDGVADFEDNCPTRYNPPNCNANDPISFPECFVDIPCKDISKAPVDCKIKDLVTQQCDSDNNGVGDQCQVLDAGACLLTGAACDVDADCGATGGTCECKNVDTDQDLIPDYDPSAKTTDNCPWVANSDQIDTDGNRIGDLCDSSVCDLAVTSGICRSGPKKNAVCQVDADCLAPVNDAAVVDATGGSLAFLIGDASGSLRPASWPPVVGLSIPVAAVTGRFSYACTSSIFGLTCRSKPDPAILVAEKGGAGSGDDALKLFTSDGLGAFAPPAPPVSAKIPLQGDPTQLLVAADQNVCPNPWLSSSDLRYHFDNDGRTSVIAAVEPGTSTLGIYLPSNEGPAPPPGHPGPLPLPSPPVEATFADLNQDGYLDLVALSSGDGNPATPNLTVFIGLGNGLFFTDPSLNPTDVPDGMRLLATGNVNLSTDSTYPDVVLFDGVAQAPLIMTNVLTDRADIDRSGRVDGYDLALLARAFGAERGEDFTIDPDGTLLQNPDLGSSPTYDPTRVVVGSGVLAEGFDLPSTTGTSGALLCDRALEPLSGLYGLPVDLNLDGKVDGTDLALLASKFGRPIP